MKAFPKTLLVKREADKDATYFVADDDPVGLVDVGDKIKIGVYKLVELREISGVVKTRTVRR